LSTHFGILYSVQRHLTTSAAKDFLTPAEMDLMLAAARDDLNWRNLASGCAGPKTSGKRRTTLGRPTIPADKAALVKQKLAQGHSVRQVAQMVGLAVGSVMKIKHGWK
jgi:hypothetical protein